MYLRLRMLGVMASLMVTTAQAQLDLGPYVQNTTEKKALVIWYSKSSEPGFLRYGTQAGQWQSTIDVPSGVVHRVEIGDLQPNTKYYYEVGTGSNAYVSGEQYFFRTHPNVGSKGAFRFMAFGDFGDGSDQQKKAAAEMIRQDAKHHFALLLGDLIYSNGERKNYLTRYFPIYKDIIRHSAWWPVLGNHDIKTDKAAAYFEFFDLPTNNPEGVENYYSFDYANAHITCLDDELLFSGSELDKQVEWLKQDLIDAKGRGQRWLIVMWHKPPYSNGSHSDDEEVQKAFLPTLDEQGADLILNGHSHVAERSFFVGNHKIMNNDLRNYRKNGFDMGSVYVVAGAGGKVDPIEGDHALMAFQLGNVSGFESIYIHGDTLKGSWIKNTGEVMDQFSVIKTGAVQTEVEIADQAISPGQFAIHYPNPFHAATPGQDLHIEFEITKPAPVRAAVYDMLGRKVVDLRAGELIDPGRHQLRWNGRDENGTIAAKGVYFYRVQAGNQVHVAKFLIMP